MKTIERKNLFDISKLEEGKNRQEAVLKRKNEEIARVTKQLHDTVKQKGHKQLNRNNLFKMEEKILIVTSLALRFLTNFRKFIL